MRTRLLAATSIKSTEKMWGDRPSTGEQVDELLSLQPTVYQPPARETRLSAADELRCIELNEMN